jgi:cell fate regulator YaaT (PSP1 superfamily)
MKYIKIEFKGNRRALYKNDMEYPIKPGDKIVVSVDKGADLGTVTSCCLKEYCSENISEYSILRKATSQDIIQLQENRILESEATHICQEKSDRLELGMKVVDVECQLDRKKITFYYTADGRVDFRELVKELAAVYKTRIEMRQIGARDEAKRLGGMGLCGLSLCCTQFIETFEPVNTQCAKDQNLPMNPSKLSGMCGKLKCCLRYEHNYYSEELSHYPRIGDKIQTEDGEGEIISVNIFTNSVTIQFESGATQEITVERDNFSFDSSTTISAT